MINSIMGKIKASRQIINHITVIVNLTCKFRNIQFSYCNRKANRLTDATIKRLILSLMVCIIVIMNDLLLVKKKLY